MSKIKEIHIPGDKSISHRAIMLGALAKGETVVNNFLMGEDCLATVECFRKMGIEIQMTNDKLKMSNEGKIIIKGKGIRGLKRAEEVLDVGNSGTTIRLMMGILAAQEFVSEITGDSSIQKRPMMRVARPLMEMGANIEGRAENNNLFAPLKIYGRKLKGITYELPVASAQVKSAILLAGLYAQGGTRVIEKHVSRDHTERMLEYFGAKPLQDFDGREIDVPGDISSAAFFMAAGILMSNVKCQMSNVGTNPTRTGIIEVLHRMGADLEIFNERIVCGEPRAEIKVKGQSLPAGRQGSKLKGIIIEGEIIPRIIDEIPIIALVATQAQGVTEIRGAKELRVKESDRIATIASELNKLGANIKELDDGMVITGPTKLQGSSPSTSLGIKVKSHGDHRIAMMLSVAGLIADGKVEVDDTACIETSFPGFQRLLDEIRV